MRYRYVFYILALIPVLIFRSFMPGEEMEYLSIADEALRNGDWLAFTHHGAAYAEKSPLYFWLLMLSRLVAGDWYVWLTGLFSLLPAVGVMVVMDRWMKLEGVRNNPLISNLLLGTTGLFTCAALALRMDMLTTLFVVLSLHAFFRIYKGVARPWERWISGVWLFLGVFTGGPLGLLIPLVPIVMFLLVRKELRTVFRYLGWRQLVVFAGLMGAWLGAVWLAGGAEQLSAIVSQNFGSLDAPRYKAHLFYYLPRVLKTFAPWSLLYLVVIWLGVRRHLFQTDSEKFFYTVIWTNIVLLSVLGAKSDMFMLPVYPFVAYLASAMLARVGGNTAVKVCVMIPAAALTLLWPASFVFKWLAPDAYSDLTLLRVAYMLGSLGGLAAIWSAYRNKISQGIWYVSTSALVAIFVGAFSLPLYDKGGDMRTVARDVQATAAADSIARFYYYGEPGLEDMDFALGRQMERLTSVSQFDTLDVSRQKSIVFIGKDIPEAEEWLNTRREAVQAGRNYFWTVVGMRPENEEGAPAPQEQ